MSEIHLSIVLVLSVACIALVVLYLTALAKLRRFAAVTRAQREAESKATELAQESRQVGKLIQDYLGFMRELYRVSALREIPGVLLKFMVWLFEPNEAVVLIRRRPAVSDEDREHQLIVAATRGTLVQQGTVVPLTDGPLSQVAASGIVLDHFDPSRDSELPGFDAELVVPLAADEEVLGVLALMRPRRRQPHARQLLQLFAQSAALAHRNAATMNRIRSEADLDPLTGVLNRGALMVLLESFAEESVRSGRPISVFLFDIDHFKNYNDTNGHLPGDDCLRLLARLVSEQTRADDAFGRYGGEEFLLVMPGRAEQEALLVAEKIRALIADYPFPYGENQPLGSVTVSGGIACLPDHARNADEALSIADESLYAAKEAGRNRVWAPGPSRQEAETEPETSPPVERDDLLQLKGVGAAYAAKLESFGLSSYRQIASLDWRQIVRLAEYLKTNPERILREEWLRQARVLHRAKYGENLEDLVS